MRSALGPVLLLALGVAAGACSEPSSPGGGSVDRGRQVYLSQCTACHAIDPAQAGPVGPAVRGSSRQLLEAKLLRGTYPEGYAPKRTTRVMPPLPALERDVPALADYLR